MAEETTIRAAALPRTGVGSAFGTCGELLQGVLAENGLDFLVTLPIRAGSVAVFEPDPRLDRVEPAPGHKVKSRQLAELMLRRQGVAGGGRLTVCSELAEGKGLASSSADLVATARAVADATGRTTTPAEIESCLRAIEPSDGVMYPGVVAFYHRQVRLRARLAPLPPLTIVAADEGGQIDTVEFNRRPKPFSIPARREYSRLLHALAAALARNDLPTIGAIATRSAVMNSVLRDRPHLGQAIDASDAIGALGVVVAHSGTMTGLLISDTDPDYPGKLAAAVRHARTYGVSVAVHRSWQPATPEHRPARNTLEEATVSHRPPTDERVDQ
ncbi:hypothetical protein AB0H36_46475 [Kribbella sp. NPDC050820]|uniref:GHMP family kinase ATP-binding protein n=1 Tax=Kribbella sp. NPDC050820 TaxID=3155408 RepID=UPI0033C072D4